MSRGEIARTIGLGAFCVVAFGWALYHSLKKSEDPARLLFKWVLTGLVIGFMVYYVGPFAGNGGGDSWVGVVAALGAGLVLTAIWRHSIGGIISKPFEMLYTGGDVEPEPKPMYSVARMKQKQGKYLESIAEIRRQLDRFPTDFEGLMFLAQVQAEDIQDLQGAQVTIERLLGQKHALQNIAYALNSMADWHLKYAQDREAAQRCLERIPELMPDTEFALAAGQRIGHLASTEFLVGQHERKRYVLKEGPHNLGLMKQRDQPKAVEVDPTEIANDYVKHLERHPLDTEVREKLAVIYANHYGRLDMATDQLEQMIAQPNQPARLVAHWLNVLADLQIRAATQYETVQQTLQRIIDLDPEAPSADLARTRLGTLKLELKGNEKKVPIKMGTYEQNIGLKRAL